MTGRLICLVPTIPQRRRSCERMLFEITGQSRVPDVVALCLDGYDRARPAPRCCLPVWEYRNPVLFGGPAQKWQVLPDLFQDDLIIGIDDDVTLREAPNLVQKLVECVEQFGGAAAGMGRLFDGRRAPPGAVSMGRLLYGAGCGLAVRAGHLQGLHARAHQVRVAGGPDAFGPRGDEDALVSAHLWCAGIPIWHAATGNYFAAPGTQDVSQTKARLAHGEDLQDQKRAIARHTGWPWVEPVDEVEKQRGLTWEKQLQAIPPGARPARGEAPPPGFVRVLVLDETEPDNSGVYDAPSGR